MGEAKEAVVVGPGQLSNDLKVFKPSQEFLKHHPKLKPSQVRSQAEVGTQSKTNVIIGTPADVEAKRAGEHRFITIKRTGGRDREIAF